MTGTGLSATILRDLAVALAIGLLVGVERGWRQRREPEGSRVAGLRTFALLGLAGGAAGVLAAQGQALFAAVLAAAAAALMVIGYNRSAEASGRVDATTAMAALLTLGLGGLATSGYAAAALAAAAVTTLILSLRQELHGLLRGLTATDIKAVARFAIIAGAIWPLLPDRAMGPYAAWNPRDLWLVVVVVTGLSFAGYAANRRLGATRGTLATAAIGAIYSSTAVTVALARQLRTGDTAPALLASGIAVASAVMYLRMLLLTAVLAPVAVVQLALITGPAALVAMLLAGWSLHRSRGARATAPALVSRNPFELLPALGFALFIAVLAVAVRWAQGRFGDAGLAALITLTGAMDVDAAIVTVGGLAPGTLSPQRAGTLLSLPVLINMLVKTAAVPASAGWRQGWRVALPLLASAAAIPVMLFVLG